MSLITPARGASLAFALLAGAPGSAAATYSIVAVDLQSGAVGGAGTSCVGANLSVSEIYGSAPGYGAVMAQASINRAGRDRAVELLEQGTGAVAIIAEISGTAFDARRGSRQYAVVDLDGEAAGFTGTSTLTFADDRQGRAGDFVYSVQGNILTGAAVLDQAARAFEGEGCDLADRLMRALEAGAENGEGDSRCTPDGIPSDGAFIQVDLPNAAAGSFLRLRVDDTAPMSPLAALRVQYDAWRATHACPTAEPMPPADGGTAGAAGASGATADAGLDGGVAGQGGARAAGAAAMGPVAPMPSAGRAGMPSAAAGSGGRAASAGASGAAGTVAGASAGAAAPATAGSTGCGVAGSGGRGVVAVWLVLMGVVRARARARAR